MNEELREDIKKILRYALSHTVTDDPEFRLILRVAKQIDALDSPTPPAEGETVRVRAGVYWDDTQKEWLVFGTLRRFQSGDTIITRIHDLELNGIIARQADPKGHHYRLWVKTMIGDPVATIEAPVPLPRIPVVEARVVEGGES